MRARALTRRPSSVDMENRTFQAILVTETPVRTWIPDPSGKRNKDGFVELIEVDEVLKVSGLDRSRTERMPLLASHNAFDLKDNLGQIPEIRTEEVEGLGPCVVVVPQLRPSLAEMMRDIAEGFYPNLSAGYSVSRYELEYREGNVPIAYAVEWTLHEGSMVSLGADHNAQVRNASSHFPLPTVHLRPTPPTPEKRSAMDFAEAALAAAETALAAIPEATPDGAAEDVVQRALSIRSRFVPKDEKPANAPADEGKRAEEEDDEKAKAEIEQVRALAKTYGQDVVAETEGFIALGARGAALKADVLAAVRRRNAAPAPAAVPQAPAAKTPTTLDTRSIYDRWNKRA